MVMGLQLAPEMSFGPGIVLCADREPIRSSSFRAGEMFCGNIKTGFAMEKAELVERRSQSPDLSVVE